MRYFLLLSFVLFFDLVLAQNDAFIKQFDNAINSEIQLIQIGESNLITGFSEFSITVEDATGNFHDAAYQYSMSGGLNKLIIKQIEPQVQNKIILSQEAFMNNTGIFNQQYGSHTLMLKEASSNGSNASYISQLNGAGCINLEQRAYFNNIIPSATNSIMDNPNGYSGIYQEGENNFIYGASVGCDPILGDVAIAEPGLPALQLSEAGSNWLEIWQTGGNNIVGLYQEAINNNQAFIHQYNGFNTAVIYQKGAGSNFVQITQAGGMIANVYQSGGGDNRAIIEQY